MIYFLTTRDAVKIGFTTKMPSNRISALQTGNPYEIKLFGVMRGDIEQERQLHEKFSDIRMMGEWFKKTEELMTFAVENTCLLEAYQDGYMDIPERKDYSIAELMEFQRRRIEDLETDVEIASSLGMSNFEFDRQLDRLRAFSHNLTKSNVNTQKPKFDRVAYQREYMRKRRAKIKSVKKSDTNEHY